ncbi:hypothetical protein OAN307_c31560 [Octadecabacter antarcticus 307]|uniref:Uncharacterized protein n=1 Tax=Octadecabacter antarcticus 307 TaxID=391626 RepID=M9RFT8_9RHOB|nr:hypothetical protein [Octadecabacter antarcticus]AGI68690.1 hypothetical protein OAN307_c31560 [Octadecabacter antarcticus 307]
MTTERKRVLAIAVASGKVAYVFLIDGKLKDWHCSRAASLSAPKGRSLFRRAVARFEPSLVVTEDPFKPTRKSGISLEVLNALVQELTDSATPHHLVQRDQQFANKYHEAQSLAKRFPAIAPWLPKTPKIWEAEPVSAIYFEALSMAALIIDDG